MALLGAIFIGWLFRPLLPAGQVDSYIAGLILLAAAPCTAMVFVWSNLLEGEPHFTLSQVALNDTIMVVAFAPLVGLLLGLSSITVPWGTLILSVVLYIVVPVIVAQLWRRTLLGNGSAALVRTLAVLGPMSLVALLATLVLLFGLQGEQIIAQPVVILLLAVPILIQVYFNAGLAYLLNRRAKVAWCVAGPSALIGASNFFELAVATAIALFGFQSGAALATVVGVLIEGAGDAVRGHHRAAEPGAGTSGGPRDGRHGHDLPQPRLRHVAQHAGDDPRDRRRAGRHRIPQKSSKPRRAAGPGAAHGHPSPRRPAPDRHAVR